MQKKPGNNFKHKVDSQGVILSLNLGVQDHYWGFDKTLIDGIPGFNLSFFAPY